MKDLAFGDLQLFARLAALGTLSAVARERDMPVSQVSRALSRIEQTCAARLVHRSTHGLALTAEGEVFLDYCLRLAGTLDELEGEFATKSQEVRGLVRVAASSLVGHYQLLPSLPGLRTRHPGLRVDLQVSDKLVDMAREGIDIAIRTATASLPDTVIARRIGTLGRALYAAPEYLSRAGMPKEPLELYRHQLVSNSAVAALNHWPFIVKGERLVIVADGHWRTNDSNVVASMVLQGLGIGRLSTIAAQPMVAQRRLVPVLADYVDLQAIPIYAVTASARHRLPKIRACIDYWAEWLSAADTRSP